MESSRFVSLFLITCFAVLFLYNFVILSDVRLLPASGASFLNTGSLTGWKFVASVLLYPARIILVGPIIPLLDLYHPPLPFQVIAFTSYWTVLALVTHYFIETISHYKP